MKFKCATWNMFSGQVASLFPGYRLPLKCATWNNLFFFVIMLIFSYIYLIAI